MTGLNPGAVLPKDMDQRQYARWCRSQSIEGVAASAIAAHVAAANPHPGYVLTAALTAALAALNLASGTYTPSLFSVSNIGASTAYSCQYVRVGSTVTVSGRVDIDPVGAVSTVLGISLPIASAFANQNELAGSGASPGIAGQCAGIFADVANARASIQWIAVDVTNQSWYFTLTYRII